MSVIRLNALQRKWHRILRNAATSARYRVLRCLQEPTCQESIGVGAGGDVTKRFDQVAEEALIEYLRRFASFTLVSEEAGIQKIGANPNGYVIMDPIDGSINTSHRLPFSCISLAWGPTLMLNSIRAAVVLELATGRCYHAEKNRGAYCDTRKIQTGKLTTSDQLVIGVDDYFPSMFHGQLSPNEPSPKIRSIRHLGSNSLEMCFVADGTLDAFVDLRGTLRGTDLAAVYLILQEAGATIIDQNEAPVNGECSKTKYALIAARDIQLAQALLRLVFPVKEE